MRSSAGRRRMQAPEAQSSLAHSRMASSAARWPSWLSECLQEKSAGTGLCYTQKTDSSHPKKTGSFLKECMDLLYDPAMSLGLKLHTHYDLRFMPIHKHTLQCVPQFTLVVQFFFPSHLFFQADQTHVLETKLYWSIQSLLPPIVAQIHKILTVGPSGFSRKP